ncbi:hypothetical protein [Variovorax sp. PBL-E5]|uniref:hypothetical protein n=1 Tax=Variovorax sp. PBL-E5 TaxID=434014 RepID=UPI0013185864|nr:hypothetical protein [Variovorax sp. PBL-E5]VTU36177.1 hypothetical protein E5CHR_04248 [Variovorax sp. PBL-E5]
MATAARLRRIAVYVDEPEKGWFAWVLIEQQEGFYEWTELDAADEWLGSYQEAMAAGLMALQALTEDLKIGPRARSAPPPAPKPPAGPFGFGSVLP